MAEHVLPFDKAHTKWNKALPPAIEIDAGDTVSCETRSAGGRITPGCDAAVLSSFNFDRPLPLAGPIFVRDARPGDVLEVEIQDVRPSRWGWSGIIPGFGLLAEDFPAPYIYHWDLSNGRDTALREDIVIPLDPFCGNMGVCPDVPHEVPIVPPGNFGGNMDIRHLTKGATLLLPVQVEGALFSAGDCHAAQGDGEVGGTGIESPTQFTLRFQVRKGIDLPGPQFLVPGPLTSKYDHAGYFATTGVGPDLMPCAKQAIRAMIAYITRTYRLPPEAAYVLCSIVVDLKISEIVDAPNWIVSAYLPLSVFRGSRDRAQ
ncbi:MAG: acetamidase/formamidase family protein [Armatimonadetes bacterium]|nr:acetamidase/formamidase family protein [Armatimonadota bacterium]